MKFRFLILILTCCLETLQAQDQLVEVSTWYRNGKLKEHFYISDTLNGIKNGEFTAYFPDGTLWKKGRFENNNKAGVWNYYDRSGLLIERYSYILHSSVEYNEPVSRIIQEFQTHTIDTAFITELERVPHFIGGKPELEAFLRENLKFPVVAKEKNLNGTVIASFSVSADGSITRPKIIRSMGSGCDEEVLRVLQLMPSWVPAIRQGQTYETIYYLPFYFDASKFLLY